MNCFKCKKEITEEELSYEDYYKVFRGENAITYKGNADYLICFACMEQIKNGI